MATAVSGSSCRTRSTTWDHVSSRLEPEKAIAMLYPQSLSTIVENREPASAGATSPGGEGGPDYSTGLFPHPRRRPAFDALSIVKGFGQRHSRSVYFLATPEDHYVEANVSTQQQTPRQDARLPCTDANPRRARDPHQAPGQRPRASFRLRPSLPSKRVRETLETGAAAHGRRVVLFVAPGPGGAAVVAGRKVGGAVARNRARRVMRAAFRELSSVIGADLDIVWVARASIRGAKTEDLVPEMSGLLGSVEVDPG